MKLKSILLTVVATISLATATMAQVPNYLPTNGLVGWWPFNGNANDESGNGYNGTVTGASLTSDRNGNANSAYNFNGSSYIFCGNISQLSTTTSPVITFSYWMKNNIETSSDIFDLRSTNNSNIGNLVNYPNSNNFSIGLYNAPASAAQVLAANQNIQNLIWTHVITELNYNTDNSKIYMNGQLIQDSILNPTALGPLTNPKLNIGSRFDFFNSRCCYFNGVLDDFTIWNRALTQQEITNIYNASNCANNTAINPQTNSLTTSSTATFTATTSDPNPSYVWQSDFGQGYVTLNNYGNYSVVNTATLNISNVQLANHNQPIRVISTSGDCIDTSNVAVINMLDTCITNVTVYDTLLTTVTDTLIINATITGINPPNNLNTLKVFPNPASTHITIDYGNFNAISGYTLTIVNSIGQTIFTTPINQQTSYIDLSTWTGTGIYFVQLIDPQNNTIENRKIVIQ